MRLKTWSPVYLLLFTNGLIAKLAGPISSGLTNFMVVILLFISFVILIEGERRKYLRRNALMALLLFVPGIALFLLTSGSVFLQILTVALICAGASKFVEIDSPDKGSLYRVLALSSFLFSLLYLITSFNPGFWFGLQLASTKLSVFVSELSGQRSLLSSTASGLQVSLLFLIFGACIFAATEDRSWKKLMYYFSGVVLCNVFFVVVVHPLAFRLYDLRMLLGISTMHSGHVHTGNLRFADINPMNLLVFLLLLQAVPLFFFVKEQNFLVASKNKSGKKWLPVIVSAMFIVFGMNLLFTPANSGADVKKNILIYDRGYLNWQKPVHGNYGLRSGGMFGMLPAYLETMGYNVHIDSTLIDESLTDIGVIVVINLSNKMSAAEKHLTQKFVKDGGALLVLGDHTGLGGIREPLNDLLDFIGVEFRFDSAHYLKDKWRDAFNILPGNLFYQVKDENDLGISVGASLDLSPGGAMPLLVAKYGFSDWGNAHNRESAFLGDRFYNPGELLGDIVLIAAKQFGKGKVLIFGDTSSFQNGELMQTFPFVQNVFNTLTGSMPGWMSPSRRLAGFSLLLISLIILLRFANPMRNSVSMLLVTVALAGAYAFFTWQTTHRSPPAKRAMPLVYIDSAHLNRFTHYGEEGIWALSYNLMRSDYLPFIFEEFTVEALKQSALAFVVSPAKQFAAGEIAALTDYMHEGGTLIWTVGYEEKSASTEMLDKFGFDLDNRPLGPIPASETSSGAKFYEAWPILLQSAASVDTLSSGWGYPVMVSKQVGKGKLILIADSGFLLSENIEQDEGFTKVNVEFLSDFFKSQNTNNK